MSDVEGKTGLISDFEKEMKVENESDGNVKKCKSRRGRSYIPSRPCKHCGKVFTRRRTMRLHIKRVHLKIKENKVERQGKRKDIKCEQCDKVVKRKTELQLHVKRAHLKIKDHVCEVCMKAFSTTNELNTHKIVHREKKFHCNICGLKIRDKRSLVNHMESRHMGISKKPYFCQDCGIHYSNTAHKLTHMDQSKLEKFTCETCGKQFGFNKNLKKHKRLHRVERDEVILSNNLKLEVLGNSEEIGADKMANLVGIKDDANKSFGHDEGRLVVHHTPQTKKEVVAYAVETSVAEAENKYNIEESTIRSWLKKLKQCEDMWEDHSAPRKDYIQRKYTAQVSLFYCLFVSYLL